MRAAIYSPYLDTLGGGERYVISFAKVLAEHGWSVDLQAKDSQIIKKLEIRFGFKLTGIKTVDDIKRGSGYDLCFWLSDGSVPALLARKNILHFQRPFYKVEGKSIINRMKFFRINKVVVNSKFTKKWIDKEYPVQSEILYPPVDVEKFKVGKKENIILNVSRFSQLEQSKRQDVLVSAFKKFYDLGNTGWKLILTGGSEVGATDFLKKLHKEANGYPIEILENPDFKSLKDIYSRAKIFWSASGYGIDEKKSPNRLEHFGITVVEAMAAGCIPFVFEAGGHREIVNTGSGFLWKSLKQLVDKTVKIVNSPDLVNLSRESKRHSKQFSYESFERQVLQII